MNTGWFSFISPFVILATIIFLIYRLKFFSKEDVNGRLPFLFGGAILFVVSIWQVTKESTSYYDWFVEGVYPVLDFVQVTLFLIGIFLVVVGLAFYADFWQTRRNDIISREKQFSLLNNLQYISREPYQLLELLNISLKEIVSTHPQTAGAFFLLNKGRKQLLLTSSAGLNKREIAYLEHYPLGQNTITQSFELDQPMISGLFYFVDDQGLDTPSRFNSSLVLPLSSGDDKIGGILLLSEEEKYFSRTEIKYLAPVAQWLAEKIKSARLIKEINYSETEIKEQKLLIQDFNQRINQASEAFNENDLITSYCRSLTGLLGSQSTHIFGLKNGALKIYGGSEPLFDLSENYKTALLDALDRKKPLIINQESQNNDGRSYIARSSFVYPIKNEMEHQALLFIKDSLPFHVDDKNLKTIDIYAHLAQLALKQSASKQLDLTRRKGMENILQLLRFDDTADFVDAPGNLLNHLDSSLPPKTMAITFLRQKHSSFKAVCGYNVGDKYLESLEIFAGETIIGQVSNSNQSKALLAKKDIKEAINAFDEENRDTLLAIFGEKGLPNLLIACPVPSLDEILGVVVFFMYDISEHEKGEWQRLLTLAAGLYSVNNMITRLSKKQHQVVLKGNIPDTLGESVNRLNNHLSAIIGNAELAADAAEAGIAPPTTYPLCNDRRGHIFRNFVTGQPEWVRE